MDKKKFNINNFFNRKLFIEAFKQIRIIGIASAIILGALAVLIPYTNYLSYKQDMINYTFKVLFDTSETMIPLIFLIVGVAPVMFITLFSFMTKRSGSDFYHSLPVKRSCLFTSFIAAIVSWILICCATFTLLMIGSANILCDNYILDYSYILAFTINIIISCMLILGAFSLGSTLTGTKMSNIFFSCGILLLPRIIICSLSSLFISYSSALTPNSGFTFFKESINIPFALLTVIWDSDTVYESTLLTLGIHSLYTIVLALIYLIIGMKLFSSRPSECASKSFRSNKIFAFLKIGSGFAISLILVTMIYPSIIYDEGSDLFDMYIAEILMLVIAMTLVMFGLETANTKSIKKGLKATIYTPILLVVDAILLFGMSSLSASYDNEVIDRDDVDYIYVGDLLTTYTYSADEYSEAYITYSNKQIAKLKITDSYIIDYLLDIYNSDRAQTLNENIFYDYYSVEITFDSFLGDKTRFVYLTQDEMKHLTERVQKNENVQKCLYEFPDVDKIAIDCYELEPKYCYELYKSLIAELKEMPYDKLFNEYCMDEYLTNYHYADTLHIQTYVNGCREYIAFPITSLTPDTYKLALSCFNENNKKATKNFLNIDLSTVEVYDLYLSFSAHNLLPDGKSDTYYSYNLYEDFPKHKEKTEQLYALLEEVVNNSYDFSNIDIYDKNLVICQVNFNYIDFYGSYYFTLPADSPFLEGLDESEYIFEE